MIPKIIHYCWFGNNPKPESVSRFINQWKEMLPDFQFMEWNEHNFDINYTNYVRQAFENKKYAFVSDVARAYALYKYGGVYIDTDIEIKRDFSDILKDSHNVFGFEMGGDNVMTAFIGAEKGSSIIKMLLDHYSSTTFIKSDGKFDITPNTFILTKILKNKGAVMNNRFQCIDDNIEIYPEEYFSAFELRFYRDISTKNTYTVHHFESSWMPEKIKLRFNLKKLLIKVLGAERYRKIYLVFKPSKLKEYHD